MKLMYPKNQYTGLCAFGINIIFIITAHFCTMLVQIRSVAMLFTQKFNIFVSRGGNLLRLYCTRSLLHTYSAIVPVGFLLQLLCSRINRG